MDSLNDDKINRHSSDWKLKAKKNKAVKRLKWMKIVFLPAPWRFMNIFAGW